ncbi:hypothetical protein J3458_003423 [Metarhizium acridum]|uniref:DRAP deaminase n=1 Tax=Metarhizium acridum (strain CQMa 102) TaxID=655827 RepID=E9E2Y0_METAQ|nr:DRAP deaminase [Metarhizium acridum CQMa 102]EFY89796.1 DRAP deaminase [Metarhizium acridum CQMa 102]KAG8421553.1 hypothetical protein J3458_003423 [Metarhizium acridum]
MSMYDDQNVLAIRFTILLIWTQRNLHGFSGHHRLGRIHAAEAVTFYFHKDVMAQTSNTATVHPVIERNDHHSFMEYALKQARLSPAAHAEFCVGAVLVDSQVNRILSAGYSMELPSPVGDQGNTHAEQCCFIKVALAHNLPPAHAEDHIRHVLPARTVLYTTMEPCSHRLSGNTTCVERILKLKGVIRSVYVGIRQPSTFVRCNDGMKRLQEAGIEVRITEDMKEYILNVSMAGH